MIEAKAPDDWKQLQEQVARIMRESGLQCETNRVVKLARGSVEVDVFASESTATGPGVIFVECKLWQRAVTQAVVHAFRTLVTDAGANTGLIISKEGFQRGAHKAAEHTNVKLLDWKQFQEQFADRWFANYMAPELSGEMDPLIEYTEPINSRIFRKANGLSPERHERFRELRKTYLPLAYGFLPFFGEFPGHKRGLPQLPLRGSLGRDYKGALPDEILDTQALRPLMDALTGKYREAIAEFDEVFGERA